MVARFNVSYQESRNSSNAFQDINSHLWRKNSINATNRVELTPENKLFLKSLGLRVRECNNNKQ